MSVVGAVAVGLVTAAGDDSLGPGEIESAALGVGDAERTAKWGGGVALLPLHPVTPTAAQATAAARPLRMLIRIGRNGRSRRTPFVPVDNPAWNFVGA